MTGKIFLTALAVVLSLGASVQKFIADKVVAVVGSSPILYSEVVEQARQMTEQYRTQNFTSDRDPMAEALENMLEQKLLFTQAQIDSVDVSGYESEISNMVNRNIEGLIAEAGGMKALETARRQPVYLLRADMRREITEYYTATEMRSTIQRQVKVTPGEVDKFFRGIDKDSLPIVPEQYVYAQITRLPASSELAKQRARERLLELRRRIIAGESFGMLAMMYSKDEGSAMRRGEMEGPKEQWVEGFANALVKLQPGQVSGVVETEFGYHIIELIEKPSENYYRFRHILIKPTYTTEEQSATLDFLDSLAGVIRTGGITFAEAAKKYSDDAATRMNGGVVSNQELLFRYYGNSDPSATQVRFAKDDLDPSDARYLIRMRQGEISRAFIGHDFRGNELAKILRLNEIVPSHRANLAEDYLRIEQLALTRKQEEHYRQWLDGKIGEMYVRIDDMFKKEDFNNKHWFK